MSAPLPARPGDLVVGPWGARFLGRRMPCSTGRGGILPAAWKREGDLTTPEGAWRLAGLYWRADRLAKPRTGARAGARAGAGARGATGIAGARGATGIAARPLGPRQGWAEDPRDPAYNRPIRHPHGFPADRMARGDRLYDICVVTDHNSAPVVPGAGSAIFVHLWRKPRHPTAGCVAFRRADLEWILRRWGPRARLVIRPRGGL